jgi:hypothetical protein
MPLHVNMYDVLNEANDAQLRAHEEHQAHLRQQADRQAARTAAAARKQLEQRQRKRLKNKAQRQRRQQAKKLEKLEEEEQEQQPPPQPAPVQQQQDPAAAAAAALAQPLPPLPPLEDQEQQDQQQAPLDVVAQREADGQRYEQQQVQVELALKARRTTLGNIMAAGSHGRVTRAAAAPWKQAMRQRVDQRLGAPVTTAQLDAACEDVLASPLLIQYMRPPAQERWAPCEPEQLPLAIWYGLRLALVGRGWDPPEEDDDYGAGAGVSDTDD